MSATDWGNWWKKFRMESFQASYPCKEVNAWAHDMTLAVKMSIRELFFGRRPDLPATRVSHNPERLLLDLLVAGEKTKFMVETGAAVTVVSK